MRWRKEIAQTPRSFSVCRTFAQDIHRYNATTQMLGVGIAMGTAPSLLHHRLAGCLTVATGQWQWHAQGWLEKKEHQPHTARSSAACSSLVILTVRIRSLHPLEKKYGNLVWVTAEMAEGRPTPSQPPCCPSGSVGLVFAVRQPSQESANLSAQSAQRPSRLTKLLTVGSAAGSAKAVQPGSRTSSAAPRPGSLLS